MEFSLRRPNGQQNSQERQRTSLCTNATETSTNTRKSQSSSLCAGRKVGKSSSYAPRYRTTKEPPCVRARCLLPWRLSLREPNIAQAIFKLSLVNFADTAMDFSPRLNNAPPKHLKPSTRGNVPTSPGELSDRCPTHKNTHGYV